MSYEEDQARILSLIKSVEEEEEILGGESSEIEDAVEIVNSNSESEQSAEEREDSSDEDIPLSQISCNIYGKDGLTVWKTIQPPQNSRTRAHNIVSHLPGVKRAAKNAKSPMEAWNIFFTDDMLQSIVIFTNCEIDRIKENYSRERNANSTNITEMKALIGLLFLAGLLKSSHLNTENLWSRDGTGIEIFPCVMSQQRFKFLLRCLRFDDKSDREERKKVDRLAPIREIFDIFVQNCKNNYTVSEYCTIDESLVGFRGRCSFRQFIRSKPAKYGIKVFCLVDARMYYTLQMEIYAGKQPDGPYQISNSPGDVVKRLIEPISKTGRNITFDNWFTSIPLAEELLKTHKLTIVGTVRKNKKEIPPEFLTTKNKEEHTSAFAFREGTLVSYIPKKGKVVLVLSTMHHSNAIDKESGDAKKPEIVTFYNETKGGVDTVDQMCESYSVSRKSNRWPLTIFYFMLNVSGINSQIIAQANTGLNEPRRVYLRRLALSLLHEHMQQRATITTLPRLLTEKIQQFAGTTETKNQDEEPLQKKRKRCNICPRNVDRKTNLTCAKCKQQVCKAHSEIVCKSCV